jgi:hypothetical protein
MSDPSSSRGGTRAGPALGRATAKAESGAGPGDQWTGIVIDITDAHGERLYEDATREEVETAVQRARAEDAEPIVILGSSSPAL